MRTEPEGGSPDVHGRAALMLVEGLLHALGESGTLTQAELLSVMATAIGVTADAVNPDAMTPGDAALLATLERIRASFQLRSSG